MYRATPKVPSTNAVHCSGSAHLAHAKYAKTPLFNVTMYRKRVSCMRITARYMVKFGHISTPHVPTWYMQLAGAVLVVGTCKKMGVKLPCGKTNVPFCPTDATRRLVWFGLVWFCYLMAGVHSPCAAACVCVLPDIMQACAPNAADYIKDKLPGPHTPKDEKSRSTRGWLSGSVRTGAGPGNLSLM